MILDRIEYLTEPAYPAFQIPVSDDDLKTLGELCAIQGQIEFLMQLTVMVLCKTSLARARKRLGSPNISYNAKIWLEAVEKNSSQKDMKKLARAVVEEIDVIRQGRNDFVHAFFAFGEGEDNFSMERNLGTDNAQKGERPIVAIHNLKANPMKNLKTTRDKAAAISHFIFAIYQAHCDIPNT